MSPDQLHQTLIATNIERKRRELLLTPAQRMILFEALQAAAWEVLSSNPDALVAFHQRNRRIRR